MRRTVGQMKSMPRASWLFGAWAGAVVLAGGILTSYHQPFLVPEANALQSALPIDVHGKGQWRATHLLSGSCECSRRVMLHLLQRRPTPGVSEQVVLVDDGQAYLPGTDGVVDSLKLAKFSVAHVAYDNVAAASEMHGVPLLMISSPAGRVEYLGGYGAAGDKDATILQKVRSGSAVSPLPVLGCAIGRQTRRSSDPFRLKY